MKNIQFIILICFIGKYIEIIDEPENDSFKCREGI